MANKAQTLPPKEHNLFKSIGRHHEKKQYKKALRCADEILAVHKTHGETMSMKGLTLNSLEKKEQAYEWAKLGLKNNISSSICWHVLGLIYRSDRNYPEAKKCYLNAMRRDKNNLTLLRDLSLLQIQLRDLPGYLKTRKAMLHLKPNRHEYWFSLSLAWQLLGHFDEAIDVMIAFEDITEESQKRKNAASGVDETVPTFEDSERKMYVIRLYDQAKRYKAGLAYLNDFQSQILDKTGLRELKASLLFKSGEFSAAQEEYLQLIDINPENHDYHAGFRKSLFPSGETAEQIEELRVRYEELAAKYPLCTAVKRIPLNFLPVGDAFQKLLDEYLQPSLRKGIPSLWKTFKDVYLASPEKGIAIGDRVSQYYTSLKASNHFPGHEDEELSEPPSTILWTVLFLAQHFEQLGDSKRALELLDEAIEHTPTAIDIYMLRAKTLKRAGDIQGSADQMDECRKMDLADRYLNTVTTKYLMQADRVSQADSTVELFTRDADNNNVSLSEMQCVWYEQNAADSYLRSGEYGKSLKKALAIDSHFQDFTEDQFDFHSYCLRKTTLTAYYELLHFEDRLYSHENYFNCARTIVRNYLALHERPVQKELTPEELFAHLSGGELRKALRKHKRDQQKKELLEKERKEAEARERQKQQSQKKKSSGPIDEDPEGKTLENVESPLNEAAKFVAQLTKWCGDRLDTHLLAFQVYSKKGKWLLAIRAHKRALALAPEHPEVYLQRVLIAHAAESLAESENATVADVVREQARSISGGKSAQQLNEELGARAKSLAEQVAFVKGALALLSEGGDKEQFSARFLTVPESTSLQSRRDAILAWEFLREAKFSAETVEQFRVAANARFPLCSHFHEKKNQDPVA